MILLQQFTKQTSDSTDQPSVIECDDRYRFEYIKDEQQDNNLVEEHRMIYESIIKQIRKKHQATVTY